MRRWQTWAVLMLAVLFLGGCANLRRWEKVQVGMSPAQVKSILGVPRELDAGDEGEGLAGSWMYENLWGTANYEIIFDKGKVAEKHARTIRSW
jgi:hypothetical protein